VSTVFNGIEELKAAAGNHLGYSDWLQIDQDRVNRFADATGDHQWIHVDVERAKRESPFGGPIAHGYLTLSLSNALLPRIVKVEGISMGVNYGVDKVRFPAPVLVGSRIRAGAELASVTEVPGGVQTKMLVTIEIEGGEKPACVVEALSRFYA
jgi:acyl dehydratase